MRPALFSPLCWLLIADRVSAVEANALIEALLFFPGSPFSLTLADV